MAPINRQTALMAHARNQATFDSSHLTEFIFGGKEEVARQDAAFERIETAMGTNDMSVLPTCYSNQNREDIFLEGLKNGKICMEDGLNYSHEIFYEKTHRWAWSNSSPFGINSLLFLPVLKLQGTEEQVKYWQPLAESGQILGSYSQTELGHGTHVRGIETTATYDDETDEFIIHSPTLSSAKFWPGAIGFTCSHSIVMAAMIIRGVDHGVHPFMVQFRNLEDYSPVKGVEMGDIGMKLAYNGADNGYATFNKVRIPRDGLLARHASVDANGVYHAHADRSKLLYGGLLAGRISIVHHTTFQLAQAVTIATRYSVVREQGQGSTDGNSTPLTGNPDSEVTIMDYKSQHQRLLTLSATAYANLFASRLATDVYNDLLKRQSTNDHSTLAYTHMLSAGLKSWSSAAATAGSEDARKLCGGHGYMSISGLQEINASVTATATFEGENYVLWQQVARYLVKGVAALTAGRKCPSDMNYIKAYAKGSTPAPCTAKQSQFRDPKVLLKLFQHRAACLIIESAEILAQDTKTMGHAKAWNTHMMALIAASRAHIELIVLDTFVSSVAQLPHSPIRAALDRLVSLHGLSTIVCPSPGASSASDVLAFVSHGHLSNAQLHAMRSEVNVLLDEILPDSISLTDAWNFTDASLCSAIGCKDGNVYERIMSWVRQLPINVNARKNGNVFKEGFELYLKPMLRRSWNESQELPIDEQEKFVMEEGRFLERAML